MQEQNKEDFGVDVFSDNVSIFSIKTGAEAALNKSLKKVNRNTYQPKLFDEFKNVLQQQIHAHVEMQDKLKDYLKIAQQTRKTQDEATYVQTEANRIQAKRLERKTNENKDSKQEILYAQ